MFTSHKECAGCFKISHKWNMVHLIMYGSKWNGGIASWWYCEDCFEQKRLKYTIDGLKRQGYKVIKKKES